MVFLKQPHWLTLTNVRCVNLRIYPDKRHFRSFPNVQFPLKKSRGGGGFYKPQSTPFTWTPLWPHSDGLKLKIKWTLTVLRSRFLHVQWLLLLVCGGGGGRHCSLKMHLDTFGTRQSVCNPSSAPYQPRDSGSFNLWASVSPSVKWGQWSIFTKLSWG